MALCRLGRAAEGRTILSRLWKTQGVNTRSVCAARGLAARMLGRKRLPRHLEAPLAELRVVIAILGQASDALTSCVPTSRLPGRSLPDGLAEFEEHLRKAVERMPGWRGPEVEVERLRGRGATGEGIGQAARPATPGPTR